MCSLIVEFDTNLHLRFELERTPIADLWQETFEQRHPWPLDDCKRFYGLKDSASEKKQALKDLEGCVATINAHEPIIDSFLDLEDQDTWNYLHSVFERYHGLLDQQNTQWWFSAPETVRQALAQLNIAVHRMESVGENLPRIVCTWFGMPKCRTLDPTLMREHGKPYVEWGGVYLNYVEIGKTLEDLAIDNDRWIGDDAFQPFHHYSADFNIRFYDEMAPLSLIAQYWQANIEFFKDRGLETWDDPAALPYRFKIAQLKTDQSRDALLDRLREVDHIIGIHIE